MRDLLDEIARFYGILVPTGDGYWQFTHRTIHDFLSARYWVESGTFDPNSVGEWDVHAAFAAALTANATNAMVRMLLRQSDLTAFIECLYNMAAFEPKSVANAAIRRAGGIGFLRAGPRCSLSTSLYSVHAVNPDDFYEVCSEEFLRVLLRCSAEYPWETEQIYKEQARIGSAAVAISAMGELILRKARIREKHFNQFALIFNERMPEGFGFVCKFPTRTLSFTFDQIASEAQSKPGETGNRR